MAGGDVDAWQMDLASWIHWLKLLRMVQAMIAAVTADELS